MLTTAVQGCFRLIRRSATLSGWTLQQDQSSADRPRLPAPQEISERWSPFSFLLHWWKAAGSRAIVCSRPKENFRDVCDLGKFSYDLFIGLCSAGVFLHSDLGVPIDDR
jgi:hypothetical protein